MQKASHLKEFLSKARHGWIRNSFESPVWAQFHIRRCRLLSKVAAGHEDEESEILELVSRSCQMTWLATES